MGGYTLLDKQKEFMEIPHKHELDVAIYQGGYGKETHKDALAIIRTKDNDGLN